jgi:NTP pyrophosphatase (non-canonical NTP hydrolase)
MSYGTNGLTFNALRGANRARLPLFKNKHGLFAHSEPDGSDWTPAQWLQAVVGELGEYDNVRKKFERGDLTYEEFQAMAASELADVATYLDILAYRVNVDLGQAIMDKFNEVSERVDAPVRLDADDWHYSRPVTVFQCGHVADEGRDTCRFCEPSK